MLWLRTVGLGFGAGVLLLMYRVLSGPIGRRPAALACVVLATIPQFTFLAPTVSNDFLAALLATGAFVMLALPSPRRASYWAAIGLLSGAAVATKMTALCGLPMIGVALLLDSRESRIRSLRHAGFCAAGFVAASGWVFLRNYRLFGDIFASDFQIAIAAPYLQRVDRSLWEFLFVANPFPFFYRTSWASLGWSMVEPDAGSWVWTLYAVLTLSAGAVIAAFLVRVARRRVSRDVERLALVAVAGVVGWVFLFVVSNTVFATNMWGGLWQGRHLYPALAPVVLLTGLAVQSQLDRRGPASASVAQILTASCLVALASAWLVVFREGLLKFHFL